MKEQDRRLGISDFSIHHPVIITIILIAVVLFGMLSLLGLKQDLLAQVYQPSILIFTTYPGVGPEDIEKEITDVIEKEISTLSGVSRISSKSENSASIITVEFGWDADLDSKLADLREKINNILADLPEGIDGPPKLFRMNASAIPILTVSIEGELEGKVLSDFAENRVAPLLARISGVSEVNIQGKEETVLDIRVNLNQLIAREISIIEIYQLLSYYNISFPAGSVVFRDKELNVRTLGEFTSVQEIENMVIGFKENTYIRLKDVAEITLKTKKSESFTISGGKQILVVDILKQQDADTKKIISQAKAVLDRISDDYRGIVEFGIISDQSVDIRLAINSVKNSAMLGGILAVAILLLFLHNLRATLIIGLSIPLSIVLAFSAMKLKGQSLNLMSLGGLTVAIGMIVDSSIVILENVHRNFDKHGDRKIAASVGTAEVGGAIIASTTTSLCVFIPILFVQGFAGVILKDSAYTIVYALGSSLIVAIVVVPFMSSFLLKAEEFRTKLFGRISRRIESLLRKLTEAYRKILTSAIENRTFVFVLALVVLVVSIFSFDFLGFTFIPPTDMSEIQIELETPPGYTLDMTREKVDTVEQMVRELVPEVDAIIFYVGQKGALSLSKSSSHAFGRIRLVETRDRDRSSFDIMDVLREEIPARIPDIDITIVNGGLDSYLAVATGGQGFVIEVFGNTMEDVVAAARRVQNIMSQDPNVSKTGLNISFNKQELVSDLALDYMGTLGVTPYEAAVSSRILFNGITIGTYREGGNSYDIFLNSEIAGETITGDILDQLAIKSSSGTLISFTNFSDISLQPSLSGINHENRMKSILVTGYLKEPNLRGTSERVTNQVRALSLPIGVDWRISGSAAEMTESFSSLMYAMLIAVFLVYMVMVIQFERFTQPLIVMASIPFTVIGIVAGLLVFRSTLSIVSFMGIIALFGIVVNNAIVLIDFINLIRRREDMDLMEAVLAGGSSRLKPILMTTLTTILGILPMALGMGEGSEMYSPLGQSIVGGLVTSTFITLFLIPVLYYTLEKRLLQRKINRG